MTPKCKKPLLILAITRTPLLLLFIISLLCQSCAIVAVPSAIYGIGYAAPVVRTYKSTMSFEDAARWYEDNAKKRRVKIVTTDDEKSIFTRIYKEEDQYYGVKKNDTVLLNEMDIATIRIENRGLSALASVPIYWGALLGIALATLAISW